MKLTSILFSVCTSLLLTACSTSNTGTSLGLSSSAHNTGAQYQQAHQYSYTIAGAIHPALTHTTSLLTSDQRRELIEGMKKAAPSDDKTVQCLIKAGMVEHIAGAMERSLEPQTLRKQLANQWANRYDVAILRDVEAYTRLSGFKKITKKELEMGGNVTPEQSLTILKQMRLSGELSEKELGEVLVAAANPSVQTFINSGAQEDMKKIIAEKVESIRTNNDHYAKDFLEQNADAIVNCAAPEGTA